MKTTLKDLMFTKAGKANEASIMAQLQQKPSQPENVIAIAPVTAPKEAPAVRPNFVDRITEDEAKLNKAEKEWLVQLRLLKYPCIGIQAIQLKLGSDCRFCPDFNAIGPNGEMIFWDVKAVRKKKKKKGAPVEEENKTAHVEDDALVKLKTAARMYRWARFIIVYKLNDQWVEKEIQP